MLRVYAHARSIKPQSIVCVANGRQQIALVETARESASIGGRGARMESSYTVGVSNRFASLMAEDDDPGDQVVTPTIVPEKADKTVKRKEVKSGVGGGGKQQKDGNREKAGQPPRKPAQDSGKREICLT